MASGRRKSGWSRPAAIPPKAIVGAGGRGDPDEIRKLLEAGADPNAVWRGYGALHALIQERPHAGPAKPDRARLKAMDVLLAGGADPEQLGAWPPTRAILVAAFTGIPEFVERLARAGAKVDGFVAAARGDAGSLKRTLKRDPTFAVARDAGGMTALQCAAASRLGEGDPKIGRGLLAAATALLNAGADPNVRTKSWSHEVTASYFAINAHNVEMTRLLLTRGADPTEALPAALWSHDRSFAELVLSFGAKPDRAGESGRPALNELIRWGQLAPALWILGHGASPNLPDARGWTALHQAVSRGSARMVEALLAAGADTTIREKEGLTPVALARTLGKKEIAAMIKRRDAAVPLSESPGSRPRSAPARSSASRTPRRSGA
jgi:ankyrin repeat protein